MGDTEITTEANEEGFLEAKLTLASPFEGNDLWQSVYSRDAVPDNDTRQDEMDAIARQIVAAGVDFVLFHNTITAAKHAVTKGWIAEENLIAIAADTGRC